jgi:predicted nucleic acid-binding protein
VQKLRIYLDTSVPSAYYDLHYPYRAEATRVFWQTLHEYEVLISTVVETELEQLRAIDPERAEQTLQMLAPFEKIPFTEEAAMLAQVYLQAQVFRSRAERDAEHVALATIAHADYLVSWNFKDLVNVKTRAKITAVNVAQGYAPVDIVAPPELTGGEDDDD